MISFLTQGWRNFLQLLATQKSFRKKSCILRVSKGDVSVGQEFSAVFLVAESAQTEPDSSYQTTTMCYTNAINDSDNELMEFADGTIMDMGEIVSCQFGIDSHGSQ
jgi:hypothetical protein